MISHQEAEPTPAAAPAAPIGAALEAIFASNEAAPDGKPNGEPAVVKALRALAERLKECPEVRERVLLRVMHATGKTGFAHVPWVGLLDERETSTAQGGVHVAFVFRADMSGVYLALTQGFALPKKKLHKLARSALARRAEVIRGRLSALEGEGFQLDGAVGLMVRRQAQADYAVSVIAHKLYERGALPPDAEILRALDALLVAYDAYLAAKVPLEAPRASAAAAAKAPPFERAAALAELTGALAERGFAFEPFQVAAYVTALRTKPFVILAGVSGTGKSKLPALVAELTGGQAMLLPVRPDWTDSADLLGYVDLKGRFRPGALLRFARAAAAQAEKHHVCVIDEMNLARVEQYFAEVLSRIEDRAEAPAGGYGTGPLLAQSLDGEGEAAWAAQGLPPNLGIVGTVNMDETTHGFSRKVLDRAFTLEIADVDLGRWEEARATQQRPVPWPVSAFCPRAIQLGALRVTDDERALVNKVIGVLSELNKVLAEAQLQVGYRVRDEVALFVLHAQEVAASFVTQKGDAVDPLDLALEMKILPRIVGGSAGIRAVVREALGYVHHGKPYEHDEDADKLLATWKKRGRPSALAEAHYPRTAARLALMWDRLLVEGYTSYWL